MTVRDEVCGMTITVERAADRCDFQGTTYHFCSERCRRRFEEHPGWYVPLKGTEGVEDPT